MIENARGDATAIHEAAARVVTQRDQALSDISASAATIDERRTEVERRSQSLIQLIERITDAEATTYFEEEASTCGGEAKVLWWSGLAVVMFTALAALLPLVIYYVDRARGRAAWLHGHDLTAAHLTAVAALGALAGVLLARARGRDRARQRARDLSVALQTMFVYAEQIDDPEGRELFIREMGRTVLEASLPPD